MSKEPEALWKWPMESPASSDLRGKRYIAYARCATKQGSIQSMRRQMHLIRKFGDRHKMRCVAESRNPGIDGYTLALRPTCTDC